MKTSAVTKNDLAGSVLAVPPLARNADYSLNAAENVKLIRHLEAGGVTTLMYGGNANFYNIGLYEYADVLDFLAQSAARNTWVIPSVGPDFGKMMDQARVLRERSFPAAMVLPLSFPATPDGVEAGVRRFVDACGKPIILYLKAENYVTHENVRRLANDGLICGIKYAIVRQDPNEDAFLTRLLDVVDRGLVISGIGERPAITHLRDFGLIGFTSGSVCVGARGSSLLLQALKAGRYDEAARLREFFLPLEDLRDTLSPIRVLHDAVTLSGIGDMGPLSPLLSNLDERHRESVRRAAHSLVKADFYRELVAVEKQ